MTTNGITATAATEMSAMEEQVYNIKQTMIGFTVDAEKVANKSAARRARKTSLAITKMLKEYRATSIK
jgi:hypothetical protein